MSYVLQNVSNIGFPDHEVDPFGRLMISGSTKVFEYKGIYGDVINKFTNIITGTGTVTFNSQDSSMLLNVGTTSGSGVIRESACYMHYEPGEGLTILMTGVLGDPKANVTSRIGYYDGNDGYYFAQTSTGPAIVERTSSSTGTMTETVISQSNWNYDKMDGTGPSGITINFANTQIFMIDLQWLGVGRVRMSLNINGVTCKIHDWNHANLIAYTYITTADQPIRYEILNTGTSASSTSMKQICCAAYVNSSNSVPYSVTAALDSGSVKTSTTGAMKPLLSIQIGSTFNGIKTRGRFNIKNLNIIETSDRIGIYRLVAGATLTGSSFTAVDSTRSFMNYDISATAMSGGQVLWTGYVQSTTGSILMESLLNEYDNWFASRPTGTNPSITIGCAGFNGTVSSSVAINWNEIR
jgi:hypothetical protein